jgi:anion-transporting  ArsA/GET3 family ATPase
MVLRFERVYKMVFENRITRYFLRAIPGLDDYSILGKAWYHVEQARFGNPTWPTVVFDMPASGHSLSMLKIPSVITDTVPEGPLTRDARTIEALLRDPERTAVVLVTLAEEMPTREAIEFAEHFRELGISLSHLVINQVFPAHFPVGSTAHAVLDGMLRAPRPLDRDLERLVTHADLARSRRELNDQYLTELRATIDAPTAELPYLFTPSLGPDDIDLLASKLDDQFSDS